MTTTAILILILASVTHAGWNILSKKNHPSISYFCLANFFGFVIFSPVVLYYRDIIYQLPKELWFLMSGGGCFFALYNYGLANAYRSGDMSLAYPLARSAPIIVVTFISIFLGQAHQISPSCVIGIVFVVFGCFLLPMHRFSKFKLNNYFNATCAFALLAAFATAGYSILDDEAIRLLEIIFKNQQGPIVLSILYVSLESLVATATLSIFLIFQSGERQNFQSILREKKLNTLLTGLGITATYIMVVISLTLVENVSYVVAFRQLSIPMGVLFSSLFLKEHISRPKWIGVTIIFIGLILVAI